MARSTLPPLDEAKLEIETAALRDVIAKLTIAWSYMESTLSLLLKGMLRDESGLYASAIYYSPASADVRIKIVDSTIQVFARASKEHARIMGCWRHTSARINRAKAVRNTVAHSVIGYSPTKTRWHTRLSPAPYDFRRNAPATPRQLPGMSTNDIKQAILAMDETAGELNGFLIIIDAVAERNDRTLRETLLELEARHSTEHPQKAARKTLKPKGQP